MRTICIEISGHGSGWSSNEKLQALLLQPFIFGTLKGYIKLVRSQDDIHATNEVADYFQYLRACGSVVLVVRAAAAYE